MKLKLKEIPREWSKFASVMMVLVTVLSWAAWRRGWLGREWFYGLAVLAAGVAMAGWLWPRAFRGFYRAGMTVSFHVGQVMGRVLLTVFFLLVLTSCGLILRLFGKDLLSLKRDPTATTYWRSGRFGDQFDRQF